MNEVYVLSGRDFLRNSEWSFGCKDASVWGVFDNFEKAKKMFHDAVLKVAQNVALHDEAFEYRKEDLFDTCCESEDSFGWECNMHDSYCEWVLFVPVNDDYDYGFWFRPMVKLQKIEMDKLLLL